MGLLKKFLEAILSFAHAFEVHSPLEGESARRGQSPKPRRWGVKRV